MLPAKVPHVGASEDSREEPRRAGSGRLDQGLKDLLQLGSQQQPSERRSERGEVQSRPSSEGLP